MHAVLGNQCRWRHWFPRNVRSGICDALAACQLQIYHSSFEPPSHVQFMVLTIHCHLELLNGSRSCLGRRDFSLPARFSWISLPSWKLVIRTPVDNSLQAFWGFIWLLQDLLRGMNPVMRPKLWFRACITVWWKHYLMLVDMITHIRFTPAPIASWPNGGLRWNCTQMTGNRRSVVGLLGQGVTFKGLTSALTCQVGDITVWSSANRTRVIWGQAIISVMETSWSGGL